jgi:hypothetical protein
MLVPCLGIGSLEFGSDEFLRWQTIYAELEGTVLN